MDELNILSLPWKAFKHTTAQYARSCDKNTERLRRKLEITCQETEAVYVWISRGANVGRY